MILQSPWGYLSHCAAHMSTSMEILSTLAFKFLWIPLSSTMGYSMRFRTLSLNTRDQYGRVIQLLTRQFQEWLVPTILIIIVKIDHYPLKQKTKKQTRLSHRTSNMHPRLRLPLPRPHATNQHGTRLRKPINQTVLIPQRCPYSPGNEPSHLPASSPALHVVDHNANPRSPKNIPSTIYPNLVPPPPTPTSRPQTLRSRKATISQRRNTVIA